MYQSVKFFLPTLFITSSIFAQQQTVVLSERTFKVGGLQTEEEYHGFAEGDIIQLTFEEENGKEIKEVEVIQLPSTSKFMEYKTNSFGPKKISVAEAGIFKFRYHNSNVAGRICKVKIERIPGSPEMLDFNTTVFWRTVYDTSYFTLPEKYLERIDTLFANVVDQQAKVNPSGKNTFNFNLPPNTVSWSYYVGVNQEGQQLFTQATDQLFEKVGPTISSIPGYGPLAALALGGVTYLTHANRGEDIDFYIVDGNNVQLFQSGQAFNYLKKGKVINDFARMTYPLTGQLHMCMFNDNLMTGVSVEIKVTAVQVNKVWATRNVQHITVNSHKVPYLKN